MRKCRSAGTAKWGRSCRRRSCWPRRPILPITRSRMRWTGIFAGAGLTIGFGKRFIERSLVKLQERQEVRDESGLAAGVFCAWCGGWGRVGCGVLFAGMLERVGEGARFSRFFSENFLHKQDYGDVAPG